MSDEKTYLFDRPRNVQRVLRLLYASATILLLLELVVHRHAERSWEGLPGFYPAYGFFGCVVLVVAAKWLRRIIMRREDYYSQGDLPPQPQHDGEAS